jgi:hypothetical protein
MINLDEFEVSHISDWMPVTEIPTDRSAKYRILCETHGTNGVYQVALTKDTKEIGKDVIHPDICYTGASKTILNRTYSIRAPKGDHGASRVIRQRGLDRETEVCIRYIYTSEAKVYDLENKIHEIALKNYGYRFKWKEASGGTSGKYSQMLDYASCLTSDELLDALSEIKELIIQKAREESEQIVKTKLNGILSGM